MTNVRKKGFTPYLVQAYFKWRNPPKDIKPREDWQNMLVVARRFEDTIYSPTRIPKEKVEQLAKIMKLLYTDNFLFKAKKEAVLFREDNLKLINA